MTVSLRDRSELPELLERSRAIHADTQDIEIMRCGFSKGTTHRLSAKDTTERVFAIDIGSCIPSFYATLNPHF